MEGSSWGWIKLQVQKVLLHINSCIEKYCHPLRGPYWYKQILTIGAWVDFGRHHSSISQFAKFESAKLALPLICPPYPRHQAPGLLWPSFNLHGFVLSYCTCLKNVSAYKFTSYVFLQERQKRSAGFRRNQTGSTMSRPGEAKALGH